MVRPLVPIIARVFGHSRVSLEFVVGEGSCFPAPVRGRFSDLGIRVLLASARVSFSHEPHARRRLTPLSGLYASLSFFDYASRIREPESNVFFVPLRREELGEVASLSRTCLILAVFESVADPGVTWRCCRETDVDGVVVVLEDFLSDLYGPLFRLMDFHNIVDALLPWCS